MGNRLRRGFPSERAGGRGGWRMRRGLGGIGGGAAGKGPAMALLLVLVPLLSGCDRPLSPSFPLFGAYFPAWLACATFGIVGALVVRVVFVRIGVDDVLPWRLLVYTCLGAGIAFALALLVYGR